MRYHSKEQLLADIEAEHGALTALLDTIPPNRYSEAGVWGDDWTVIDLVAHLAEWHRMFLGWHADGLEGKTPEMPAPGYRWNQTPELNRAIQKKHQGRSYEEVRAESSRTHARVLKLASELSEEELLEPGHFSWTGKNALVTYLGANSSSHYRFAMKVLKRWLRERPEADGGES